MFLASSSQKNLALTVSEGCQSSYALAYQDSRISLKKRIKCATLSLALWAAKGFVGEPLVLTKVINLES